MNDLQKLAERFPEWVTADKTEFWPSKGRFARGEYTIHRHEWGRVDYEESRAVLTALCHEIAEAHGYKVTEGCRLPRCHEWQWELWKRWPSGQWTAWDFAPTIIDAVCAIPREEA